MSDGAPISQEIRLPTNTEEVGKAVAKLDELIAKVHKLETAGEGHRKKTEETDNAFKKMASTFSKVIRGEILMAEGFHGISAAAGEAKAQSMEFLEFVGAIAALELLKKIGEAVVDIGKEALHSAANAERMNFAIDASAGGKEAGENVRKWVEANAKFSEFTEEANETAYLNLRRFGVGQDKAGLYMKAAEDLAAVSAPGEREGVYQEALSSFARLHAKGRLDTRSAMRLGIGVEDLKTLPGYKGLSNQKVAEKAEKGNLDENTLFALLMKHVGEKAIGEKSADASGLLLTKFTKLSELPELFYKRLADTAPIKKLTGELDVMLEKLAPDSPTGKKIFGGLEAIISSVADAVGEIDFDEVGETIRNDVVPAIKAIVGELRPTIELVERLIRGFHRLHDMVAGDSKSMNQALVDSGIGGDRARMGAKGGLPSQQDHGAFTNFIYRYTPVGYMADSLHARLNKGGEEAGKAFGEGFAGGVQDSTAKGDDAASGLGESGISSLNESIGAHSPSRKAKRSGHFVGEGFALGIEGSEDRISDAMDSTMRVPFDGFGGVGSAAASGVGVGATFNITVGDIHVNGSSDTAGAMRAAREELIRSLRPEFISMLEDIG